MNPFTNFLRQWNPDTNLDEFIRYWDTLERVMVAVYRKKTTPVAAEAEFYRVWLWLRQQYDEWEGVLRPYWKQTLVAGMPTQTDPFQLLLDIPNPQAIGGDWRAMQHLPAAREALNQYILNQMP